MELSNCALVHFPTRRRLGADLTVELTRQQLLLLLPVTPTERRCAATKASCRGCWPLATPLSGLRGRHSVTDRPAPGQSNTAGTSWAERAGLPSWATWSVICCRW